MSAPYFKEVFYNSTRITFEHLEPFTFAFESTTAKRVLRVHVTYTNHCFTRRITEEEPADNDLLFDTNTARPRVFCPIRWKNSKQLRDVIEGQLNNSHTKVLQTNKSRNWVYSIKIDDPAGPYHVIFSVSRATGEKKKIQDLNLVVETAFYEKPEIGPPDTLGRMSFWLVCANIYLNRYTRTKR